MLQFQCCVNTTALKQSYNELRETSTLPQSYKHSPWTPMTVEMTASLLLIRQQLLKEQENDQQRDILLKAGSLEIIRFVSQLADIYTTQSKDKNKSVNQTLKQESLHLQFADILSEMRHALTHKAIPDKKLIISSINYILEYLQKNYWEIKLEDQSPILQIRANLQHKLDSLVDESDISLEEEYGNFTQIQLQSTLVFCLDYMIGLVDFHVIHKTVEQRIKDRKSGELRVPIISKFIIILIQHLLNNKNTHHVKRQLTRRKFICSDFAFIALYNKLNVIGFIKQSIKNFVILLEQELPELKFVKKIANLEINENEKGIEEVPDIIIKKRKLIGSCYCDYVNNINDEINE